MATLNLTQILLAFGDATQNNNPLRQFFNWTRRLVGIPCTNPKSDPYTIQPQTALTIFNGSRATAIDGTSAFTTSKNAFSAGTYRFTNVAGTAPAFRTARALSLATKAVTLTANGDGTTTMSIVPDASNAFAAVQIGDVVFIPGLTTGDTLGPFNTANEGAWNVLVNGNYSLVLGRTGLYSGVTETQTPASNPQVIAYSASGVQVGDKVDISAGFTPTIWSAFVVTQVTPTWFEVSSGVAIPVQTAIIPGATGMLFYGVAKKWVRFETDQEVIIRYNGDTGNFNRVTPISAGDQETPGYAEKLGTVFSVTVFNRALVPASVTMWSVE